MAKGLVHPVAPGNTSITVTHPTLGTIHVPVAVTAVAQVLNHLTLGISSGSVVETDPAPTLTLGAWQTADESTPYTDTLNPAPAYSGNAGTVATINSTTGIITLQGPGSVTFTVTAGGKSATANLTVTAAPPSYTLTAVPNPISGAAGATFQLTVTENGVDVTADPGTVYSIADPTKATVDAPTLTSISPNTIVQGASGSYTFTGTNIKGNETIGGLPTGVTASALTYTSTTVVCTLTATGSATTGAASLSLVASGRGTSGTKTLTVNSASSLTALPVAGAVLRLHAGAGVTLNGSTASNWADQSATGASFAQATAANQPTFVANAYKGATKPALRFAGNQWLATAANIAALNPSGAFTLYVVMKLSSLTFNDRWVFSSFDGTASTGYGLSPCDGNEQQQFRLYTGTAPVGVAGGFTDATTLHSLTALLGAGLASLYKDNTNINSAGSAYAANTTLASCVGTSASSVGTSTANFNGDICEIILFPAAHSTTDRASMETYFASEWETA